MGEIPPLVNEAMKKAGLVWVRPPAAERAIAVWALWQDGAAYVVTGQGEQPAPGLAGAGSCEVTVASTDKRYGRIVTWRAEVSRLDPSGPEWDEIVPVLVGKRLNLPDQDTAAQRWAERGAVLRLTPTGALVESGGSLPDGSLAAPPPPSPARTRTTVPFTVGRATRGTRRR